MVERITPNRLGIVGESDSISIQNAVNYAKKTGVNQIVIPKKNFRTGETVWIIDQAILLPSDMTVILDNCHLRLKDGAFCNIFRNENMYTEKSLTLAGEQNNINIIGKGYAVLDGGKTNFMLECNYKTFDCVDKKEGLRVNNLVLLHNVNGFRLENFEVRDQRWWAINCIYCQNGHISDIISDADNYVPNQDGINLRLGCNNVLVERISGVSGDDLVALTYLATNDAFAVKGKEPHLHDVVVRDVIGTSAKQGMVVIRNQDYIEAHDVKIENVIHSNRGNNNFKGYVSVRVGQNGYFRDYESKMGSTRNITVKNVVGSTSTTIMVGATLKDCKFENIRADGGYWVFLSQGVKMQDVEIDGLYYEQRFFEKQAGAYGIIEDTNPFSPNGYMREEDYIKNLTVKNYVNASGEEKVYLNPNIENEVYLESEKL